MRLLGIALTVFMLQTVSASQQQMGSIEGRVMSAAGGVLPKAKVTLIGPNALMQFPPTALAQAGQTLLEAVTDVDGKFRFNDLEPGIYRLYASRNGFTGTDYGQKGPNGVGALILITAGQRRKDLELALTPQGVITGRVVDRNGLPVSSTSVSAYQFFYRGAPLKSGLSAVATATTNERGEYRLYWLKPGNYVVGTSGATTQGTIRIANSVTIVQVSIASLSPTVRVPRSDGSFDEEVPARTYFPGTVTEKDATDVVVRSGETVGGIDFALHSVRVYRIRGVTINSNTGLPESMPLQLLATEALDGVPTARPSSESGTFEIAGVRPGSYLLNGIPIVVRDSDVTNVVLNAVGNPINLTGRIVMERSPNKDSPLKPGTRISLSGTFRAVIGMNEIQNGSFSLQVVPGDYQIQLEESDLYLKSARLGNKDVLDILPLQSQPEGPMEIVIGSNKGRVDGRIVNSRREPVANAKVILIPNPPLRQRTSLYVNAPVDPSGSIHISAIPGEYKIFAWEDVEDGAWFDPNFMATIEGRGRPIIISEGSHESVEVSVIPYQP